MNGRMWGIFWGGLLVVAGTLFLLSNLGLVPFSLEELWSYGWPLLLVVIGLLVIFGGNLSRGQDESSDRVVRYTGRTVQDVNLSYSFGDHDVHLTDAVVPDGTAHIKISQGIGDLDIWLPRSVPVWARVSAGLGDVKLFDQTRDGFGPRLEYTSPDYANAAKRIELKAEVGMGDINIQFGP